MITIKTNNLLKILLSIMLISGFVACDEGGDPDPGATATVELAGDWFVQTFYQGDLVLDYVQIASFNTAANTSTEMWLDDNGHIWPFKVKVPIDLNSKSFSGASLTDEYNGITVNITNGIVVKDGATTTGGNTSDSISFDIEFSDDPGFTYHIEGYKRTGFLEDEH